MSGERRKIRVGTVIQDRMDKTVVVAVEWRRPHNLYRKPVRRRSRFYAHDEANQCRIGDEVRIIETRPLSRLKRWRVVEVLSSTDIAEIAPQEIDREIIEGTDAPGEAPVEAAAPAVVVEQADAAPEEAAAEAEQEASAPDAPVAGADADDEATSAPDAPVAEADAGDEAASAQEAPAAEADAGDEAASAQEAPVAEADAGAVEDAPETEAPAAEAPAEEAAAEANGEAADEGEAEEKKETSE